MLDLGSGSGSFPLQRTEVEVLRVDIEMPRSKAGGAYALADAAQLPFSSGCCDLVVSNHSLEHFVRLEDTLREVGRVLRQGGRFYVAVPDATTLTDRIYRWMARGGGHVNRFRSAEEVVNVVEELTGLRHWSTRVLFSSLSFLNAHNFVNRPPRKILLFACGHEGFLAEFMWFLRFLDRHLGTRFSLYGWSFVFGGEETGFGSEQWVNVCVRCGSGHSAEYLRAGGIVHRVFRLIPVYYCPVCGGFNLLTPDAA